jgi:hypothetical protein
VVGHPWLAGIPGDYGCLLPHGIQTHLIYPIGNIKNDAA